MGGLVLKSDLQMNSDPPTEVCSPSQPAMRSLWSHRRRPEAGIALQRRGEQQWERLMVCRQEESMRYKAVDEKASEAAGGGYEGYWTLRLSLLGFLLPLPVKDIQEKWQRECIQALLVCFNQTVDKLPIKSDSFDEA